MKTFSELERAAYIAGDTSLAAHYHACETVERLEDELCAFYLDAPMDVQIEEHVEEETEKKCPNYSEYKQFFEDCVGALGKQWPCAEITDCKLQQVIFDAITKGDIK